MSDASIPSAPPAPASSASKSATIKVSVPQKDGEIVITTFDTAEPYVFPVSSGVATATSQAEADLLLARVDGATLAK